MATQWVTAYRRTEDPKLAYLERRLAEQGIPSRRNGDSWHAPILEVPAEHEGAAWDLLGEQWGDVQLDDVPDDDPRFGEG
jgi:hypothetical protein